MRQEMAGAIRPAFFPIPGNQGLAGCTCLRLRIRYLEPTLVLAANPTSPEAKRSKEVGKGTTTWG